MRKKIGICALCFIMLGQTLAGCAGMSEQQSGAATGAGAGAVLGALAGGLIGGNWQGALIGAGTGALIGGIVGWQVGEYRARKVKESQEAAAAYKYTPEQGTLAKIDLTDAAPKQLKPGDQIVLQTEYTVLAPPQQGQVKVKEVRTIFYNNQQLHQLEKTSELATGTYVSEQPLTIPSNAPEGRYTVTTLVEPVVEKATKDQAETGFLVRATSPAPAK